MKRRREQERDEATAREQADARREALLADLKARQTAAAPEAEPAPVEPPPAEPPPAEAEVDESEPSTKDEPGTA